MSLPENNEEKKSLFQKLQNIEIGGKKEKEAKTDFNFGSFPIANLMPLNEQEKREKSRAFRRWTFIFIISLIISAFVIIMSMAWNYYNNSILETEQEKQETIEAEMDEYSETREAEAERNRLLDVRADAMSLEVDWGNLIESIDEGISSSARISEFSVINGGSDDDATVVAQATIISPAMLDYADVVHSTPNTNRVELGTFSRLSSNDPSVSMYTYDVVFEFDQTLLVDRYGQDEEDETDTDDESNDNSESAGDGE